MRQTGKTFRFAYDDQWISVSDSGDRYILLAEVAHVNREWIAPFKNDQLHLRQDLGAFLLIQQHLRVHQHILLNLESAG